MAWNLASLKLSCLSFRQIFCHEKLYEKRKELYSECLKTKLLKSKLCRNPKGRGLGFQTAWISDVRAFETTAQLSEIQTGHPPP